MDPITLASITSGVTVLATEFAKGTVSEAGKDAWNKIKSLLGWKGDPPQDKLAPAIAKRLQDDDVVAKRIVALLKQQQTGSASALVGSIDAEKVVVAKQINVAGDWVM